MKKMGIKGEGQGGQEEPQIPVKTNQNTVQNEFKLI